MVEVTVLPAVDQVLDPRQSAPSIALERDRATGNLCVPMDYDNIIGMRRSAMQVWDTDSLSYIPLTADMLGGGAGGNVTVDNFPVVQAVSQSGAWSVSVTGSVAVTGPLTDAALRAAPVDVAGTVTANTGLSQPLTDTQLRATPLPVSGTVTANTGLSQPLTDTQLRATPVPVSGTVTAGQGTAAAGTGAWPVSVTDSSNTIVKPGDAANSALRVNVVAGSGGGVTHTDDAAFTPATDDGVPIFGVCDDTSTDLVDEGDAGAVRMSRRRELIVTGDRNISVYNYLIPSQVHVAAANTVHWDMFNADAALVVRVLSIKQIPNITTAVTGIVFDWLLERTTAVGTGGSAITAWLSDLNDTALDADITCRSKPTGGATQSTDLRNYSISSEETNAATIQIAAQGGLELVPDTLQPWASGKGIVLRQNQGLRCVQVTSSNAGNTGWLISFTVEPA